MSISRTKKSLNERLDWLLAAIHSGKYDELVSTRCKALIDAYVIAVNATIVLSPHGPRVVSFGQDLIELSERGLLMRSKQVFSGEQDEGLPTWVYAYQLTSVGKSVAEALVAEAVVNTNDDQSPANL